MLIETKKNYNMNQNIDQINTVTSLQIRLELNYKRNQQYQSQIDIVQMGTYFCQEVDEREQSRIQQLKLVYRSANIPSIKPYQSIMKSKQYFPCKYLGKGIYGTTIQVILRPKKQQRYAQKILSTDLLLENYVFLDPQKFQRLNSSDLFMRVKDMSIENQKMYILFQRYYLGDLYNYVKKYPKRIDESFIKQFTIRIVQILQTLHNEHKIIYRNLRPQNILFNDESGNFVLTEIMFCYDGQVGWSYYGAATYTPPEIYNHCEQGYDSSIDYWMLGVLLYEILLGKTPFESATLPQIKENVINFDPDNLKFPQQLHFPQQLTDFITKLLEPNPKQRMTIDEIKRHQLFYGENWDQDRQIQLFQLAKTNPEKQDVYSPNRIVFYNFQKARPLTRKIQPYNNSKEP